MPGVQGVSREVAWQASQFIAKEAHAVIAVCKHREYAPIVRIAESVGDHGELRVDACISNQPADFWLADEETIRKGAAAWKQATVAELGRTLNLTTDSVYVVHLKTLAGEPVQFRGVRVTSESATHQEEEDALRRRIWQVVDERGVDEVILAGTQGAELALLNLRSHLGTRAKLLNTLLRGDESSEQIAADLGAARVEADEHWARHSRAEVVDTLAANEWQLLKPKLDEAQETVLAAAREELKKLEAHEGRLSKDEAKAIYDRLNGVVRNALGDVEEGQRQQLQDIVERYLDAANEALDLVYARVPAMRSQLDEGHRLSAEGLLAFQLDRLDDDALGIAAKTMLAGGLSIAGGMLAGGSTLTGIAILTPALGPFGAALVGALGAGALGVAAVDWFRGGQLSNARRGITKVQEEALRLDISSSGELYAAWRRMFGEIAGSVGGYLTGRLDALARLAEDPASSGETLERELEQVTDTDERVAALLARLADIGARAATPAR